ncbi:hypothetical protein DFH94DRAFT_683723 [Russula ochroleuca]|uniref:Uncharacterized protein n=1 Tax=Russula ochroleuca TaxID=152965 RepID=A0A9P5MPI1_9AGAM|nr:hypothetical protein DFH94DRAFT_687165 [Russula ochroleuca]KAF8476306.1 hypothetical protein DFH94DRAFT_683723 [Russula ochroleuca]
MTSDSFFFSWEENWGSAQSGVPRIKTLAPSPSERRPCTASTLPTLPAIRGVTQKVPARRLKKAKQFQDARTQRQVSEPSSPPVSTAIPPHAPPQFAHAHLSSVPRTGHYNPISVPSAARAGHEHKPRSSKLSEDDDDFAPVSTPTASDESSSLAFLAMLHLSAALGTQSRHAPGPDGHAYEVAWRAEACLTARVPIRKDCLDWRYSNLVDSTQLEPVR